jgi:hypothetical protein
LGLFALTVPASPGGDGDEGGTTNAAAVALTEHAARAWSQCRERMLAVLELHRESASLPSRSWLRRDRRKAAEDVNALLDEILDVLRVSALSECRADYAELADSIAERREDVRRLRERSITAPERKSVLTFLSLTRDGCLRRINRREREIAFLQEQQDALVEELAAEYKRMGMPLHPDQVRFYLSSVSGKDIMSLSAVFDNVRMLNAQLEKLLAANRGDPEAARRYYGIHLVMIQTVLRAHEVVLANIRDRYLVRLDELSTRNASVREETEALMAGGPTPEQRQILAASLQAQATTDEALSLYRMHLQTMAERIGKAHEALHSRYMIARNAYETISVSSALAAEMQTAIEGIAALRRMHLPELIPFDNEAIQQRFNEITVALEAE